MGQGRGALLSQQRSRPKQLLSMLALAHRPQQHLHLLRRQRQCRHLRHPPHLLLQVCRLPLRSKLWRPRSASLRERIQLVSKRSFITSTRHCLLEPQGTGDCDGAVNGADGKPIKVPCSCPPDQATFNQVSHHLDAETGTLTSPYAL